jgi:hypothetical protein
MNRETGFEGLKGESSEGVNAALAFCRFIPMEFYQIFKIFILFKYSVNMWTFKQKFYRNKLQ